MQIVDTERFKTRSISALMPDSAAFAEVACNGD